MNNEKGFATSLLLIFAAILLLGGGAYLYTQHKQTNQSVATSTPVQATSTTEVSTSHTNIKSLTTASSIVKVGDKFSSLTVKSITIEPNRWGKDTYVSFTGNIIVTGTVEYNAMLGSTCMDMEADMPIPDLIGGKYNQRTFCFRGDNLENLPGEATNGAEGRKMTVEIKNYEYVSSDTPTDAFISSAELVRVVQ